MTTTHKCPAPGCDIQVPHEQYACRSHWFAIPKDIRSRIWNGYRSGDDGAHVAAMADAGEFLRAKYGEVTA